MIDRLFCFCYFRGMGVQSKSPRNRLLIAAERLFETQGFHATGIDQILQEAGAAKASLYQHFPSKDGLVTEVLRVKSRKVLDWLKSGVESKAGSEPGTAIGALFDTYASWFEEDGFNGCLFAKAALEYPDKTHTAHKVAAAHTRKLFSYLEELCRSAGAPASHAEHILILLEGATEVASKTGAGRAPADRARENAHRLFAS